MNIQFKNFLPSNLRNTRWSEFIEAFQSIATDIRQEKVDRIKTQFDLDLMTSDEKISFARTLGFDLLIYEGYTSSDYYLRKQVSTIVDRILWKTTRTGYRYIHYVYNMKGDCYPLLVNLDDTLEPILNWWGFSENPTIVDSLDSEGNNILYYFPLKWDAGEYSWDVDETWDATFEVYSNPRETGLDTTYLDTDDYPNIDLDSFINQLSRHLLLTYQFRFVENATEFISAETALAFWHDATLNKKKVEVLYFEPMLVINANEDNTLRTTTYSNYDGTISATQQTIQIKDKLDSIEKIRFGNGGHTVVDSSITDVQSFISSTELLLDGDCDVIDQQPEYLKFRKELTDHCKWYNFSEIAFFNSLDECILYTKFPKINFSSKMNSNVCVEVNLF